MFQYHDSLFESSMISLELDMISLELGVIGLEFGEFQLQLGKKECLGFTHAHSR